MRGKFTKDYWIIKFSGLFDPVYYIKQYPDVRQEGIDPLEHFVLHGWKEGRNPNEWFDMKRFLEENQNFLSENSNPLVYLILKEVNLKNISKVISYVRNFGFRKTTLKLKDRLMKNINNEDNYVKWIKLYDTITDEDILRIKTHIEKLKLKPVISIIMPVYNTPEKFLREAIESVINQIYPYWELCIADDASTEPHVRKILEEYKSKDKRIKVTYRETNGHISESSNTALELATGEFVAFLDHDDVLSPLALYFVAVEINNYPNVNVIYTDEDKIDEYGNRRDPFFKPDWNYEYFLGANYICHFLVYRKSLVDSVGGFRKGFEGAQDWDLALRIIEKIPHNTIRHIPFVLYHWRIHSQSTAHSIGAKPYARESQYKALMEHFQRNNIDVELIDVLGVHWRVRYKIKEKPIVSIIIPTKDKKDLLERCILSILSKTKYSNYEIIIINNNSEQEETFKFFEFLKTSYPKKIKIIDYNVPFNWSKINNYAVNFAKGELFLFLNNDTEVINDDWLEEMVSHIMKKDVGVVGAKLYYPNNTIQHAGVILGIGGFARHAFRYFPKDSPGYFARLTLAQELSCVTGACMLVKSEVFEKVGGFDEKFAVAFNDVDFCIRVTQLGYKIIFTPFAELYHYEGISRGIDTLDNPRFRKEIQMMQERWGSLLLNDPAYNPNLTLDREDFSLAFPPRVIKPWQI